MAYLDNTEITVDAILTKKGREKLAAGDGLNITKFALGDDEVDYTLYEPAHPKGSAYCQQAYSQGVHYTQSIRNSEFNSQLSL